MINNFGLADGKKTDNEKSKVYNVTHDEGAGFRIKLLIYRMSKFQNVSK